MRFYSNVGCYHGRKPEQMERKLAGFIQRQPSKQPDGNVPKGVTLKSGRGDVKDSYLTGHAGGEAHPHFDKKPKQR